MLEISNVKVYDLKESVIATRNAMRTKLPEYTDEEFEKSLERLKKLVSISKSTNVHCHDNALVGIRVSFDIKYPGYISPELQRYHFCDIVCSSSKMHKLISMDMDNSFNKYVSTLSKEQMKQFIAKYNEIPSYENFMNVISNCPYGLELFMRCSTNYKQLQTIYAQRKHHRLTEDWGAFCKFIEDLPYAKDLIL